jgi:hypothetical protein
MLQMNSTSFGHYVSFVRACDGDSSHGQWYVCDDSRVARTRASDVLSQNAYMLFYQRDSPRPAPQPGYVRPQPLLPLTVAQRAAAAAAAAAPTTPKAQEAVKANGLVPAAAAAGDEEAAAAAEQAVPDTLHLDQHQLQQELLQAAKDMLLERQQQQQEQQQQPLLVPMHSQPAPPAEAEGGELLPRIATAPAALALLAGHAGSSSRDEDETGSHVTTSSCLADVSECSTPSSLANEVAHAGSSWAGKHSRNSSSGSSSGSRVAGQGAPEQPAGDADGQAGGEKLPQHTLLRRRQRSAQTQTQQQQQQAPVSKAAAAAAAAGHKVPSAAAAPAGPAPCSSDSSSTHDTTTSSSSGLPTPQHRVVAASPELVQVYVHLPGITSVAAVRTAVEASALQGQQRCLCVQVPGCFADLQVPLSQLQVQPGQEVGSVSGRFYKRKQQLKLKLHLTAADSSSKGSTGSPPVLVFHLSESFDSSSGSESEGGYTPSAAAARRGLGTGMHALASERDLSSFFGRHTDVVARQLMQQLRPKQQAPAEAEEGGGSSAVEPEGGSSGAAAAAADRKVSPSRKPAGKKKGAGKKKKRK